MNLTTGEWIPVVWDDGKAGRVSLRTVFEQGDRIRDLAVRPHERIALMRLLVCIAQAALDGPRNHDDWKRCLPRLPHAACEYLDRWQHAFELFGEGQRFLQVPNVEPTKAEDNPEPPLISKLDTALATGNAPTLFDNAGGSVRQFEPARVALMLLAFQCFSPGGLLSQCLWNGLKTKKPGNVAGPCLAGKMVHAWLLDRASLLRSVWLNLLNKDQLQGKQEWGVPVWERLPVGSDDRPAVQNASATYMGRLVPVCRAVKLMPDGVSMIWGCAIDFPNFDSSGWRDASATIFTARGSNGELVRRQLAGSLERSLWRELGVIAVIDHAGETLLGGPFALQNAADIGEIDVFAGAVVHAKGKTTTILNVVESVLHIPAPMFADQGQLLYREGVEEAERWGRRINRAIAACHRALHDELDRAEFRKRGNLVKQKAAAHYWTAIEQKVPLLLALVNDPSPLRPDDAGRDRWGGTEWGRALARAAREAYDLACPRETPRQLKAYALGLSALFRPLEDTKDKATEEEETE